MNNGCERNQSSFSVTENNEKKANLKTMCFLFLFFQIRSHCVAQASLKLVILLPQPPKCWEHRHPSLPGNIFQNYYSFFFFFLMVLGFELKASWVLGRCFTTWATSCTFYFYFLDRVLPFTQAGLGWSSSCLWLPHSWGRYHCVLVICWDGCLAKF
jgi:hypothetical protein